MKPLISVIVPIYKVEKYLGECINSIINQTYKNLEIILVDDGSPDNCGKICDEYAHKDSRIRVIHKENGGLSDARNAGMKIATGAFLFFIDSDDYITKDAIEYLFSFVTNNNISVAIGGVEKFEEESGRIIYSTASETDVIKIMTKTEAMEDYFRSDWAAWARLYRREVHMGINFPYGEINEDEAIVLKLLDKCNTVVKTNRVIYKYRYRENSITSVSFSKKKLVRYYNYIKNCEFIKANYPQLLPLAKEKLYSGTSWSLNNMTADTKQFKEDIKLLRRTLREKYQPFFKLEYFKNKNTFRDWLLVYAYYPYALVVKALGKHYT